MPEFPHIAFMSTSRSRRLLTAFTVTAALALAGCATEENADAGASRDQGGSATTVQNCGLDVAVDGPPERVYAAYQPAIEIAHALGLGDRLIETAYLDSRVLPEHVEAQKQAKYVEKLPSREALLATNPDFVLSGFNGVFASENPNSFGTRTSLAELGVQSWILSPLCPSQDGLNDAAIDPATVRVDAIHEDLRALGKIFNAQDKAEAVIAEQNARIEAVQKAVADAPKPKVAFVSPRADGSFSVAGGSDFGTQIIEHAGGQNVFKDLTGARNNQIELEELVKRNPDVILTSTCCDASYTREDAAKDVKKLTTQPALAGINAVADDKVYPFLFADRSAGVRAAHSIEIVASLLHPDLKTPVKDPQG